MSGEPTWKGTNFSSRPKNTLPLKLFLNFSREQFSQRKRKFGWRFRFHSARAPLPVPPPCVARGADSSASPHLCAGSATRCTPFKERLAQIILILLRIIRTHLVQGQNEGDSRSLCKHGQYIDPANTQGPAHLGKICHPSFS